VVSGEALGANRCAGNCPLKLVLAPSPGSTLKYAVAHRKKAITIDPNGDWAVPTVARFPDRESRDGFLRLVTASEETAWEAKPIAEDGRAAWVRWRAGHFLSLNDMAYAQHGCIKVTVVRRWS
jgi:hypothetical protein